MECCTTIGTSEHLCQNWKKSEIHKTKRKKSTQQMEGKNSNKQSDLELGEGEILGISADVILDVQLEELFF